MVVSTACLLQLHLSIKQQCGLKVLSHVIPFKKMSYKIVLLSSYISFDSYMPPKSLWTVTAAMELKDACSLEEKL